MSTSTSYHEIRMASIRTARESGVTVYPAGYPIMQASIFRSKYQHLENDTCDDESVQLAGRVVNKRDASKSLIFVDVRADEATDVCFQILLSKKVYRLAGAAHAVADGGLVMHERMEWSDIRTGINRGDIVTVYGLPHRTKRGELSVQAHAFQRLAPCLYEIPRALEDRRLIDRDRYLHYIINPKARRATICRARVLRQMRDFMDRNAFMELETPMLETGTGANAKPFTTRYHAMRTDVNLRVAPELNLKRAVVAGFGRVYEIGRQFRNECDDHTHNPEFTTCEFYMPYADLETLMTMTEQMLTELGLPGTIGQRHGFPFDRVFIMPYLEEILSSEGREVTLEPPYDTEEFRQRLIELTVDRGLALPSVNTTPKLLDNLICELIESQIRERPTFLIGHPMVMCPLAKPDPEHPHLASRFELFVPWYTSASTASASTDSPSNPADATGAESVPLDENGAADSSTDGDAYRARGDSTVLAPAYDTCMELCNAYIECNDPELQRQQFQAQKAHGEAGDEDIVQTDESFCRALEYGLPPTGGWGMGIDRLLMVLTGITNISDVMTFPLTRSGLERGESVQLVQPIS